MNVSAWDEECDVVVVGAGAGGMAAAVTAADAGLRVLLVEKTDQNRWFDGDFGGGRCGRR